MESLQALEIVWIMFIQALGDWLIEPMRFFSTLGIEEFYLLLMPILYWSVHPTFGFRLAIMLLLSNGLNSALKLAFHAPRPYWVDTQVRALSVETSFGAPSGHAQNAASLWGLAAVFLGGIWTRAALVLVIFLIGFSRVFLGMHFISDVLLGWAAGGLLLWAYLKLERRLVPWLRVQSLRSMLLFSLGTSIALALLVILPAAALGSWAVPAAWEANALAAFPDDPIHPLSLNSAFTISGTWLGLMAGVAWLYHRKGWYSASGSLFQRIARLIIGLAGVAVLWMGLGQIFPGEQDMLSFALRFVRYTLVGLWVSALAPLLFARLKLSNGWEAPARTQELPGTPALLDK